MRYRDLIRRLVDDGWTLDRTAGSHQQYRHLTKSGTVTVPAGGELGNDVPVGTLNSALRRAGLERD